ncbi:MAG: hypothetical protein AAF995_02870 [Planctomycetota bacterium]
MMPGVGGAIAIPEHDLGVALTPAAWTTPQRAAHADEDRAAMGLPTDRPVVMSGHQALAFHAGIAARLAALIAWSERAGAHPAWLVADQEPGNPFSLDLPGRPGVALSPGYAATGNAPLGLNAPAAMDAPNRLPDDPPGLTRRYIERLRAHEDAPSAALQVARAMLDVLIPAMGFDTRPTLVCATDLIATRAFAWHVSECKADPRRMHDRYNTAASEQPAAGVRALVTHRNGAVELPLWRVRSAGARLPVFDAYHLDDEGLLVLPRALGMTGVARHALCDTFIHGAGGLAYEPVNDSGWHGLAPLCPVVGATATLLLDPNAGPAPDPQHLAWRAHHARHHPKMVGDEDTQRARDALVARLDELPAGAPERRETFDALQSLLRTHRETHAEQLAALRDRAGDSIQQAERHRGLVARDWPWCVHDEDRLRALGDRVRREIDAAAEGSL